MIRKVVNYSKRQINSQIQDTNIRVIVHSIFQNYVSNKKKK